MPRLFKVLNRSSGDVQFTAKIECDAAEATSVKRGLAVKWAVKNKIYLNGADLGGAYLRGADLTGAYLNGAYLRGADLNGAYLSGADLSRVNLSGADLSGAYLRGAYLSGVNLNGACLRGVKLIGSRPIIQIDNIGSRGDALICFITNDGVRISAGNNCFFGTMEEFLAAVEKKHGDSDHGKEYRAAIEFFKAHAALWTPKEQE